MFILIGRERRGVGERVRDTARREENLPSVISLSRSPQQLSQIPAYATYSKSPTQGAGIQVLETSLAVHRPSIKQEIGWSIVARNGFKHFNKAYACHY